MPRLRDETYHRGKLDTEASRRVLLSLRRLQGALAALSMYVSQTLKPDIAAAEGRKSRRKSAHLGCRRQDSPPPYIFSLSLSLTLTLTLSLGSGGAICGDYSCVLDAAEV